MRGLAVFSLLVCLHGAPPGARAQGVRLEDAVEAALRANPDLLAARLRVDSAHAEGRIAAALPNPVFASAANQPWQYTATVSLDVTPQRVYRVRAAHRGTDAAAADLEDTRRQVTFDVRAAFADVLLAEEQRRTAAERREIFRQVLAADSARLRSGDVPARDVAKAELELARAEAAVTRADADVHAARLALQLLMGVAAPDTGLRVEGALTYRPVAVPEDSLALLAQGRPDLRAARDREEQGQALRRLAGTSWVPVPEVTLVHQHGGSFATGDLFTNGTANAIGFGFSVPLLSWNAGERERARAGYEAARLATRRLTAQVSTDLATAFDGYLAARSLAERYQDGLLARADTVLGTARYAYGTGAISLLDLLDAVREYGETRAEYYAAAHEYWVSVYALSRATGREFVQ